MDLVLVRIVCALPNLQPLVGEVGESGNHLVRQRFRAEACVCAAGCGRSGAEASGRYIPTRLMRVLSTCSLEILLEEEHPLENLAHSAHDRLPGRLVFLINRHMQMNPA